MLQTSDISLLNFVGTYFRLPDKIFEVDKKSKKLHLFYSLLSKQFVRDIITQKNLLVNSETLSKIKEYLAHKIDKNLSYERFKTGLSTLTIQNGKAYNTYVFILTSLNESSNINILNYKETNLISWLGGVVQKDDDIHISVQYNLTKEGVIQLLGLFDFIIGLTNLSEFEEIYCNHSSGISKSGPEKLANSDLLQIDISAIRKYIVPAAERREHYRWQFCGPGRTILRQVKVRSTLVKEHFRKGKRI